MSEQHDISNALAEAKGLFLSSEEEAELEELAGLLEDEGDTHQAATDSLPDQHYVSSNAPSVVGGAVHAPNRGNKVGIEEPSPKPKPEAAV